MENLDPVTRRKHAAMLDRLSARHLSRSVGSNDTTQNTAAGFVSDFAESKRAIESSLSALLESPSANPKPDLDQLVAAVANLDHRLAENSYLLPAYELRSSLQSLTDLKSAIDAANSRLVPRKKFSFAKKKKKSEDVILEKSSALPEACIVGSEKTACFKSSDAEYKVKPQDDGSTEKLDLAIFPEGPGFRNKKGLVLVKDFRASHSVNGDFTLSDLEDCKVYLKGRLRALFIHRVKQCNVFAGPVLGSIHIENANDCTFVLASHQIRIHEARSTEFYLRLRSRPIIEDSNGVRFAPYVLAYDGLDQELRESGLCEENGNWGNVDDFKWLRAVQSPNWSVIPEEERCGVVEISEI